MKIKEANDIEEKLNEVERLLKNAINMPCKVSPSAATLIESDDVKSLILAILKLFYN